MNRCKACRHWIRWEDEYSHIGKCGSEKFVFEHYEMPSDGLAYWDAESYGGGFGTGPDFGCVHWEAAGT